MRMRVEGTLAADDARKLAAFAAVNGARSAVKTPRGIDVVRGGIATRNFAEGSCGDRSSERTTALETNALPSRDHHNAKDNFPGGSLKTAQNANRRRDECTRPPR